MSAQTAEAPSVSQLFDRLDAIEDKLDRLLRAVPDPSPVISLAQRLPFPSPGRSVEAVLAAVQTQSGFTLDDLNRRDQTMPLRAWRMIAMAAIRQWCGLSFTVIGRVFDRDHTTVHNACRRVAESASMRSALDVVLAKLDQS